MTNSKDNCRAYAQFAKVYNRLMSGKKYEIWDKLIGEIVGSYRMPAGSRCLDIACGTGRVSKLLADRGFRVTGIDSSKEMIAEARKLYGEIAAFKLADIRDFAVKNLKADFAVSFYDSLNYLLTDADMVKMFRAVKRHLAPGGIFLFDMNTRDHVAASQHNKPRVFQGDGFTAAFEFGGRGRIWTLDIDLFFHKKGGKFTHSHETHKERGYDEADILPLLQSAGLSHRETRREYKTYEDGKKHLSRLYFIAQN